MEEITLFSKGLFSNITPFKLSLSSHMLVPDNLEIAKSPGLVIIILIVKNLTLFLFCVVFFEISIALRGHTTPCKNTHSHVQAYQKPFCWDSSTAKNIKAATNYHRSLVCLRCSLTSMSRGQSFRQVMLFLYFHRLSFYNIPSRVNWSYSLGFIYSFSLHLFIQLDSIL